jgi:hypothetical protein
MISQERKLHLLSRGNLARIALDVFSTEIKEHHDALLSQAKCLHRGGQYTHDQLISLMGGLCALDDVFEKMNQYILAANRIEKEKESEK